MRPLGAERVWRLCCHGISRGPSTAELAARSPSLRMTALGVGLLGRGFGCGSCGAISFAQDDGVLGAPTKVVRVAGCGDRWGSIIFGSGYV